MLPFEEQWNDFHLRASGKFEPMFGRGRPNERCQAREFFRECISGAVSIAVLNA
jgi:hypothetical protein